MNTSTLYAVKTEIPSNDKAIQFAETYIDTFGGMPDDAILIDVTQRYIDKIGLNGSKIESNPLYTYVRYVREINGRPVVGGGGVIEVYLGENGDLLGFIKIWHDSIESVPIPILSAEDAYQRLLKGETMNGIPQNGRDLIYIDKIELGYYESGSGAITQWILPVWIFSGYTENHEQICLIVSAET